LNRDSSSTSELRQRILLASVQLFSENGYGSTSVREVVEAVGCTKPALYYHFGSKQELYLEAVQTCLGEVVADLGDVAASGGPARDRLERVVEVLLGRVQQHPERVRLILTAEHRPSGDGTPEVDLLSLHMEMMSVLGALVAEGQIAGAVRRDIDPLDLALAFIGMIHVHTLSALYGVQRCSDVPTQLTDIFFSGAQPRE
jgi:AcrR family transcriptional regulator